MKRENHTYLFLDRKSIYPFEYGLACHECFLNEKEYHVGLPIEDDNRCIRGFLPYIPGSVRVEGYMEGHKVCEEVTSTPEAPSKLLFASNQDLGYASAPPTGFINQAGVQTWSADKDFRQMVELCSTDAAGRPCFRSNPLIHFEVQGPIRLMGLDDGCLLHGAEYRSDQVRAYQGRCSMVVGGSGSCGYARVIASAEGMKPAILECHMT